MENLVLPLFMLFCIGFEWLTGKYREGRRTAKDWQMAGLCTAAMFAVQRPLLIAAIFFLLSGLFPQYRDALNWIDQEYFWSGLIAYILIEEYLHGLGHWFSHSRRPKYKWLQPVQAFYRLAHRPHHLVGSNDGKGQLGVTQTFIEGWGWFFILPSFWFQFSALYFGLYEIFIWGTLFKGLWALHVHTNWHYDLYLLNHPNPWIRKFTYGLSHIVTLPTTHHHHHARGKNSAKNMHNLLAIYDWLIYDSLVIETEAPKQYGWKQSEKEERSILYRFFNTNINAK